MMADALLPIYLSLADQFSQGFPVSRPTARTVGREAEFPVVTPQGEAADVRRLWETLMADGDLRPKYEPGRPGHRDLIVTLEGDDYTFALEVGLGTVELNTRPCADLCEAKLILEAAVRRLVLAANRFGWRVLAYGIQPVSPATVRIMAPKERYLSLYRSMGAQWLWYTVTASDQIQVSLTREEMVPMLNFGNLMTPVIIALCANSPVYNGRMSQFCSAREGQMASIYAQEHRHGMLTRPIVDMVDYVEMMSQTTYLIRRDDGKIIPGSKPFVEYLRENGADLEAFLFHDHYMWNSARLRPAFGTVEIRPACQQPWREHMAASALGLGLIEAADAIMDYVEESFGEEAWPIMIDYHGLVMRHGLRAPQPSPDFLERIVEMTDAALCERGFGEERFLEPLFKRLNRRMNPAQRIRAFYRTDGLNGLLNRASIRPGATTPASSL
jgi:gamma-glutamylcysteine synthetase